MTVRIATRPSSQRRVRWSVLAAVTVLLGLQAMLGAPRAAAAPFGDCPVPPPEVVSSGMTGAIDPTTGQGLAGSIYLQYGYAGQVWHVYDADGGVVCAAPAAEASTWVGNQLFNVAKVIVASVNSLHYMIYEGGLAWQLDQVVKAGAQATFDAFAGPFLVLALLLAGIFVFWYVFRGDNAGVAKSGGRVAAGLALVAATAFSPLVYTNLFDKLLIDGFKAAQTEIDQVLYSGQGDEVVFRHVLPTTLHREIVYENWLRGEFGDPNSELARKLGPKLVAAQACSWTEVRSDSCDVEAKQQQFEQIANKIEDHGNYAVFTGESGGRVGAGALALAESLIFGLLQLVAKLGILLGQLVLRVVVLFGPILGILAMAPGVGRTMARGILGVGVLSLLFNVVAGVHTYLIIKIWETDLTLMAKLAVVTLITMLIWSVLRPVKRLKTMLASSMQTMPGEGLHRAAHWLQHSHMMHALKKKRGRRHGLSFDKDFWLSKDQVAEPPDYGDGNPGTVWATATRPEAEQPHAALLPSATTGSDPHGPGPSGAGGAGRRPRPGRGPGGAGTAAAEPSTRTGTDYGDRPPTIRAEATIVTDSPESSPPTASDAPPMALPGSRAQLPPGTHDQDETARGASDEHEPGERTEAAAPSAERTSSDDETPGRPTPADGPPQIYNPRTGRVEPDSAPDEPPQHSRPEADDPPQGRGNNGESDADPH